MVQNRGSAHMRENMLTASRVSRYQETILNFYATDAKHRATTDIFNSKIFRIHAIQSKGMRCFYKAYNEKTKEMLMEKNWYVQGGFVNVAIVRKHWDVLSLKVIAQYLKFYFIKPQYLYSTWPSVTSFEIKYERQSCFK